MLARMGYFAVMASLVVLPVFAAQQNKPTLAFIRVLDTSGNQKDAGSGLLLSHEGFVATAAHLLSTYNPATDQIKVSLGKSKLDCFTCDKIPLCGQR